MKGVAVQLCTWDVQGGWVWVSFACGEVRREWCTSVRLQHWRRQCSVHTHSPSRPPGPCGQLARECQPTRRCHWPAGPHMQAGGAADGGEPRPGVAPRVTIRGSLVQRSREDTGRTPQASTTTGKWTTFPAGSLWSSMTHGQHATNWALGRIASAFKTKI